MTSKSARKFDLPQATIDRIECRSCGQPRPLDEYRRVQARPESLHMDFCVHCERKHGTLTLYRRYNAYGTPQIIEAVFAASRTPVARRSAEQVRLLVEAASAGPVESREDLLQREMARREMARRRLIYFVTTMLPGYRPGWVHQDIARRLERFMHRIEAGQAPRLMLFLPPRHGKSQLASGAFPSWVLGHHPDWKVIQASYGLDLALDFSEENRNRLRDPEYQAIFPNTRLSRERQGIEAWKTTHGGGYIAAGVGTGITGKGSHIGIGDDLIKDYEAAQSDTIRDSTYNWYQGVFRNRLAPGGGIVLIMTRWHFADVAGRLLDEDALLEKAGVPDAERESWEVVCYPAIATGDEYLMRDSTIELDADPQAALRLLRRKGEPLHPERYPLHELLKLRNAYTRSMWSALYQQNPTPEEGDFFQKDDLRHRWLAPEYRSQCRVFITTDYAIGQKRRNDYTAVGAFALDAADDLYVLEARRGRWKTDDIVNNIVAMIERHQPQVYAGEHGQVHMAVWPLIEKALDQKRIYVSVDETLVPMQDKQTRARPLQGRTQRHKLFFSYDGSVRPDVYDAVEREMLQFPNGANDDCVDMLAWGARLALNLSLPVASAAMPKRRSWKDTLNRAGASASGYMAA